MKKRGAFDLRSSADLRQKIDPDTLETFKEFPPRQKAASFTIDQVLQKLTEGTKSS